MTIQHQRHMAIYLRYIKSDSFMCISSTNDDKFEVNFNEL